MVTDAHAPEAEGTGLDELVSDAAEVTRHLAEVPHARHVVAIPEQAVGVVAGLDAYGD